MGLASPFEPWVDPSSLGAHIPSMEKKTRNRPSNVRPEDVQAIAARMKALRATTGLSQEKFAASVGLSYKQWGNIEAGYARIGIDAALCLTREMAVPLDWIYTGQAAWLPAGLRDKLKALEDAKVEEDAEPKRA